MITEAQIDAALTAACFYSTTQSRKDMRAALDAALDLKDAEIARLRVALLDANQICRSAWQIANRIATEHSTHEMGTRFGAFSERVHESLERQHQTILATGGYQVSNV